MMRSKILFAFLCVIVLLGCEDDKDPVSSKGDIYVTVVENGGYYGVSGPVEGATVFTVPPTQQGVTDEFGTTLIRGIESGSYEIYAEVSGYGAGKAVVNVQADSLDRVNIYIERGVSTGYTPKIEVILPSLPANFSLGENVIFSFNVTDEDSPASDIDVVISSSLDGELHKTNPDVNDNVRFETADLSRGVHTISVSATDADGFIASKTFDLSTLAPGPLTLTSAEAVTSGVELKWEQYGMDDFKRYELLRATGIDAEGTIITSFSTIETTEFVDELPPLVSEVYYYLRIVNTDGHTRNSNKIKVEQPAGKIYYDLPKFAVHHPSEPVVFIYDEFSNKLKAINYETQTEINSVALQGSIGRFAVGDNGYGLEVYVPNNSGFIHIYNANTFDLVYSINTGLPTECVVTNNKGYIVASVEPSPWWEQPVRTYSRATGINISGNGDFEGDYLRFVPNSNNIVSISRQVIPVDMEYFELDDEGKILKHYDDSYHGDHPLDPNIFRISLNGEFTVTSTYGAVYSATSSMIYKGMIDRGTLTFSDFAFNEEGTIIYAGTSNRKSIQIIKYPELTRSDEILLKGYPKFLFNYGDEIISISKVDMNSENFAIERIKIN